MHSNAQQSGCKDPEKGKHHRGLEGRRTPGSIARLVFIGEDGLHHEGGAEGQVNEPHEENAAEHQDSQAELVAEAAFCEDLHQIPAMTGHGCRLSPSVCF